jgi:hypothetical protein
VAPRDARTSRIGEIILNNGIHVKQICLFSLLFASIIHVVCWIWLLIFCLNYSCCPTGRMLFIAKNVSWDYRYAYFLPLCKQALAEECSVLSAVGGLLCSIGSFWTEYERYYFSHRQLLRYVAFTSVEC